MPKRLISAFAAAKWLCDRHTATLEQETLAEFISSGTYERYLRCVRRTNASRRKTLLASIHTYLGDTVEVTGDGAGAHIVMWPRKRISEQSVITKAASHGVGVYAISPYYLKRPPRVGVLLGIRVCGKHKSARASGASRKRSKCITAALLLSVIRFASVATIRLPARSGTNWKKNFRRLLRKATLA